MENTNAVWDKIFIGLGIITVISGVLLVFQNQPLIGIPGSIVGVWLVMTNMKKTKVENNE